MKLITVNSTIRKTVKIILSISIIALLVGLCPREFITVDATDISEIEETYPYIYWLPDYKTLIVSNTALGGYTITDSNGILLRNLDENVYEQTSTTEAYLLTIANYQQGDCYTLVYNEVTGWEARQPMMVRKRSVATVYTAPMITLYSGERVYTNGVSVPSPYASAGSTLPSDLPPFDDLQDAINAALNATTSVTTQAVTINNNINNTYNTYQSGGITEAEFNAQMEEYRTQLEALSNNSGATFADQMAVNNALTNLDITINQQVNNANSQLLSKLDTYRGMLYGYVNQYRNGTLAQATAIKQIYNLINTIQQLQEEYTSTADINAINATINYGNSCIDSIANNSDLDKDVAESANASMESEMQFVDSLLAETTQSLEQLTPKLDSEESTKALAWIGMIWENEFFEQVLPWCAIAMLVCLVLGVRYRT